jgi:hypothetical protein
MSKQPITAEETLFCGIDVSAKSLTVAAIQQRSRPLDQRTFANTASGHKSLIAWLQKSKRRCE